VSRRENADALPRRAIQRVREHVFRPMMMEARAAGSLPCRPGNVTDNDGKTNDESGNGNRQWETQRDAKRKAAPRLCIVRHRGFSLSRPRARPLPFSLALAG